MRGLIIYTSDDANKLFLEKEFNTFSRFDSKFYFKKCNHLTASAWTAHLLDPLIEVTMLIPTLYHVLYDTKELTYSFKYKPQGPLEGRPPELRTTDCTTR